MTTADRAQACAALVAELEQVEEGK